MSPQIHQRVHRGQDEETGSCKDRLICLKLPRALESSAWYSQYTEGTRDSTRTHSWGQEIRVPLQPGPVPTNRLASPQMPTVVSGLLSLGGCRSQRDGSLGAPAVPLGEKQSSSAFPPHFTMGTPPWVLCVLTLFFLLLLRTDLDS